MSCARLDIFEEEVDVPVQTPKLIRSVSSSQEEIIQDIITLYCPNGIECDPTYSTGVFYRNIPSPKIKLDLHPQFPGTIAADVQYLPLASHSLNNLMFDPPFIGGSKTDEGKDGIIKKRFSCYPNIPALWKMYSNALVEFYRVLVPGGILIFKCQDTVESSLNYFSHSWVMNEAVSLGFYPKDLFILVVSNRLIQSNLKKQQHARKYHSYFWVFEKKDCKIAYF